MKDKDSKAREKSAKERGRWVDKDRLLALVSKYREDLATDPDKARVPEELGVLCIKMCDNVLSSRCWCGYPHHQKEDMKSLALLRCVGACAKADPNLGASKVFSYFSRTIWLAYSNSVMKEYDLVEKKAKYLRDQLELRGVSDGKIDEIVGRKNGERYSENRHKDQWYSSGYLSEEKRNCAKTSGKSKKGDENGRK